jgi:thiamine biosynthesis lipoprotein
MKPSGRCAWFLWAIAGVMYAAASAFPHARAQDMLPRSREFTEVHMGMPVRIVLYADEDAAIRVAAEAAFARIAALDAVMSDYRPDSELSRLALHGRGWTRVSAELFTVLDRAVMIARASDGAFDPSVAPLVALWREARKTGRMPECSAIDAARARVGWRHIRLDRVRRAVRLELPGMRLDLGGIAKGYILAAALATLRTRGVGRALIEAGGDIVVGDAPPGRSGWTIETPQADASFADRASRLTNAALATSGASAQFVEIEGVRYSHVIDPRTGLGLTNSFVANVIAADGATADALATALTIVGPDNAGALLAQFPGTIASVSTAASAVARDRTSPCQPRP